MTSIWMKSLAGEIRSSLKWKPTAFSQIHRGASSSFCFCYRGRANITSQTTHSVKFQSISSCQKSGPIPDRTIHDPKSPARINESPLSFSNTWDDRFTELKNYKVLHGDCVVPLKYPGGLGNWSAAQRYHFKKGSRHLTLDRIEKLKWEGFVWDVNEWKWENMMEELRRYIVENGDCSVPKGSGSLGMWVKTQRKQYKALKEGKSSFLTEDRINCLDRVEFVWDVNDALWKDKFKDLQQFKVKHGHSLVPRGSGSLGEWVNTQRRQYKLWKRKKKSSLTSERIQLLERELFVWDVYDDFWNEQFEELKNFHSENGHCLVPTKDSILGTWVNHMRYQYKAWKDNKESTLTEERVELLQNQNFCWDVNDALWNQKFRELKVFKAANGHCFPKGSGKLGLWVRTQRKQYKEYEEGKESPLTEQRVEMLEEEKFPWDIYESPWINTNV